MGFSLRTSWSHSSFLSSMAAPPPECGAPQGSTTARVGVLLPKALGRVKDNLSHLRILFPKTVSHFLGWPQPSQVTEDDLECPPLLTLFPKARCPDVHGCTRFMWCWGWIRDLRASWAT